MAATTQHWNGKKYHRYSSQQEKVAEMLIQQYSFKETDSVLDVGCGDGKITHKIAQKISKGKIVGIDPSESMINFAQNTFGGKNIQFQLGKASELSFDNQFDVVASFSSLHWEPNQKEALLCFKNALKAGGSILLAIPGPNSILRSVLNEVCARDRWSCFFQHYQSPGRIWTANEYAELLLEIHFTIRKIERVGRPYLFEEESEYKGLLEAMLPHLSCIPIMFHEDFLKEVIDVVKKKDFMHGLGGLSFDVEVLEIIASK